MKYFIEGNEIERTRERDRRRRSAVDLALFEAALCEQDADGHRGREGRRDDDREDVQRSD